MHRAANWTRVGRPRGFLRARGAHFVFTAKASQPTLLDDIRRFFDNRGEPDFREPPPSSTAALESRAIWTTDRLNGHLTFPHVGQAFPVERSVTEKKSGKTSVEHAFGVASHSRDTADPRRLLLLNRGHWTVESVHNILDNAFDEDRLCIRTGQGPVNTTRLRRLAIGQTPLRRRRHAPRPQPSPRLRLPAHDSKLLRTPTRPSRENKLAVTLLTTAFSPATQKTTSACTTQCPMPRTCCRIAW